MQFTTSLLVAYSTIASAQFSWRDWGAANPCARSCFSSAYPGTSSQWSSHCATQTLLNDCISSACPTLTAVQSSTSAAQSAQCSAYSSCSTVQDACTNAYPWWGGWGWDGPYRDGLYTVTATDSHTGLTTRTVTSTFSGVVSTATETATLVAAAVASASSTGASATATSTQTNAASSLGVNVAGALIGAAAVAMVAM